MTAYEVAGSISYHAGLILRKDQCVRQARVKVATLGGAAGGDLSCRPRAGTDRALAPSPPPGLRRAEDRAPNGREQRGSIGAAARKSFWFGHLDHLAHVITPRGHMC